MRVIAWIVLGLVIGSLATLQVANTLRAANAVPHGVMNLLGYHMGQAREQIGSGNCSADTGRHLRALAVLASDIKPAFLSAEAPDEVFARYADDLQQVSEQASAVNPAECKALAEPFGKIGDACKACHRDYK